jgi:glutamine synthetase
MVDELRASVRELETLAARHHKDEVSEMRFLRDHVVPAMARIRAACDALERVTPADLWPMPTYAEMLLMK